MAKLIDIEEWQEIIVDEIMVALENGEINYDEENIDGIVIEFICEKYEDEEMDEDLRDDLLQYVDEMVELIQEQYSGYEEEEEADIGFN